MPKNSEPELLNVPLLLDVLRCIEFDSPKSWADIIRRIGMTRPGVTRQTLWRMLNRAEAVLGVCVMLRDGVPSVERWGLLDRTEVRR